MNTESLADTAGVAEKLDALIEATRAASLPRMERWVDAAGVGALLGYTARQVAERLACRADFPQPLRLDGHGRPRWKVAEVLAWADRQRNSALAGRPRAVTS